MQQVYNIRSLTAIFWLGFFMAISFLETPLKFRVEGVSMALAVSIGRVMFGALNKCEWAFFLILAVSWLLARPDSFVTVLIATAGFILLLQTFYLLPLLDARAVRVINQTLSPGSNMHFMYVLLDVLKIPVLFLIGWKSVYRRKAFG